MVKNKNIGYDHCAENLQERLHKSLCAYSRDTTFLVVQNPYEELPTDMSHVVYWSSTENTPSRAALEEVHGQVEQSSTRAGKRNPVTVSQRIRGENINSVQVVSISEPGIWHVRKQIHRLPCGLLHACDGVGALSSWLYGVMDWLTKTARISCAMIIDLIRGPTNATPSVRSQHPNN
jgi:hypothetical protein